jgi:hypothetical protein
MPRHIFKTKNSGKKYKTIFNQTPKTHIFSANMYEFKIIGIFHILKSRFPEYEYIKEWHPYVSEKDGTLHFDTAIDAKS